MSNLSKYLTVIHFGFFIAGGLVSLPPSATASELSAGKAIYKKANCMGCHKWHGKGGGGYGGVALSLRETLLDKQTLALVIKCGRPESGMPFHDRKAYRGENTECYDNTGEELGDAMPPRARYFLKDAEIAEVVDYVANEIQGKGEPGYSDCTAFWGADAKRCRMMAQ
jgi:mono/diheme cytochrome c family protein